MTNIEDIKQLPLSDPFISTIRDSGDHKSYEITLPKLWMQAHAYKKGDTLRIHARKIEVPKK